MGIAGGSGSGCVVQGCVRSPSMRGLVLVGVAKEKRPSASNGEVSFTATNLSLVECGSSSRVVVIEGPWR